MREQLRQLTGEARTATVVRPELEPWAQELRAWGRTLEVGEPVAEAVVEQWVALALGLRARARQSVATAHWTAAQRTLQRWRQLVQQATRRQRQRRVARLVAPRMTHKPGEVRRKIVPRGLAAADCMGFDLVVLDAACTASSQVQEHQVTDVCSVYAQRRPARRRGAQFATATDFEKPGTVTWHRRGSQRVAAIQARWHAGPPRSHCSVRPPMEWSRDVRVTTDSGTQRDTWFLQGLTALEARLEGAKMVAFAWSEDRDRRDAIAAFARRHPDIEVTVVTDSSDLRGDLMRKASSEAATLRKASTPARRLASQMPTARLRALSRAVCEDLDLALLASPAAAPEDGDKVFRATESPQHKQARSAYAHVALALTRQGDVDEAEALLAEAPGSPGDTPEDDPVWQVQQAHLRLRQYRSELAEHNAAADEQYRDLVRAQVESGAVDPRGACEALMGTVLAHAMLAGCGEEEQEAHAVLAGCGEGKKGGETETETETDEREQADAEREH